PIQWISYRQGKKLSLEQHPRLPVWILFTQGDHHLFSAGHGLQPWVVEENSLSLAALHCKQRRPLLIKIPAFTIDKSSNCLQLGSCRRSASRQRFGERKSGGI